MSDLNKKIYETVETWSDGTLPIFGGVLGSHVRDTIAQQSRLILRCQHQVAAGDQQFSDAAQECSLVGDVRQDLQADCDILARAAQVERHEVAGNQPNAWHALCRARQNLVGQVCPRHLTEVRKLSGQTTSPAPYVDQSHIPSAGLSNQDSTTSACSTETSEISPSRVDAFHVPERPLDLDWCRRRHRPLFRKAGTRGQGGEPLHDAQLSTGRKTSISIWISVTP